jgi:alpha-glucosidase (family GH31 glycosyl hydrolase)
LLTGHPLIPPKKMFGLWVSEFGFDNWAELDDKLRTLRQHKFPVDGFVFDLEWFGAEQYKVRNDTMPLFEKVYMGKLAWDERNFPKPEQKLVQLKTDGLGTMVIQEPYVARHLPEFDEYEKNNALVKDSSGSTGYIFQQPMWFSGPTGGGMFDYTSSAAGDYVFKNKILKLINMGLVGNWLDLGEPEHFQPWARYHRGSHAQVNNMYAFLWEKSIYDGYKKYNVQARPFMMCRTGAPGMQRYGAILWNGDPMLKIGNMQATGANLANLSLTGVFYYGTCAGGFYHRPDFGVDTNAFYTRWYAYSCLYDQPIWPHNFNPHNIPGDQAAPDRIGDMPGNLFATRQRYELLPYYYSLAYKAYKDGDAIYAPLLYYYQNDSTVKDLGNQIMIGEYMMGTVPDTYDGMKRRIYLPAGIWYNWHDLRKTISNNTWTEVPYFRSDVFKLPLFVKQGAIIPLAWVDENTHNTLGKRGDTVQHNEFIVRVFPAKEKTSFTFYEDDGQTVDYLNGGYATTTIYQVLKSKILEIIIGSSAGNYKPVAGRNNIIEVITEAPATSVELNGIRLPLVKSEALFNKSSQGFINLKNGVLKCKSGKLGVEIEKKFIIHFYRDTPVTAIAATDFNALFTRYNSGGWTGGDVSYSHVLPGGGSFWLFGDSFVDTVYPDRHRSPGPFIHSTIVLTDAAGRFTTLFNGTTKNPKPFFETEEPVQYWPNCAFVNSDQTRIYVLMVIIRVTGEGGLFGFKTIGNAVGVLSLPDCKLIKTVEFSHNVTIDWSSGTYEEGKYVYIYGAESVGVSKFMHVCRTLRSDPFKKTEYYNGSEWVTDSAQSARIKDDIGQQYTFFKSGSKYYLLSAASFLGPDIYLWDAASPTGPFTRKRKVYTVPQAGGNIISYSATVHTEFTRNDQLLVSYCVNSHDPKDIYSNADNYRPYFIRVSNWR